MLREEYKYRIKKEYLTKFTRSDKVVDKSGYDYVIRRTGSLFNGYYEGNIYRVLRAHGSFIYIDNAGYEKIIINSKEWLLATEDEIEEHMLEERELWRKPKGRGDKK